MSRVIFEELAARLPRVHEKLAELAAEAIEHINQVERQMLPEEDRELQKGEELPTIDEEYVRSFLRKPLPMPARVMVPGTDVRCGGVLHAPNRRDLLAKHFEREAAPAIEFARQISDPPGFEGKG